MSLVKRDLFSLSPPSEPVSIADVLLVGPTLYPSNHRRGRLVTSAVQDDFSSAFLCCNFNSSRNRFACLIGVGIGTSPEKMTRFEGQKRERPDTHENTHALMGCRAHIPEIDDSDRLGFFWGLQYA